MRHYGLEIGDEVAFPIMGTDKTIRGKVTFLDTWDNNSGIIEDLEGTEHKVVCEWCTKIHSKEQLLVVIKQLQDALAVSLAGWRPSDSDSDTRDRYIKLVRRKYL